MNRLLLVTNGVFLATSIPLLSRDSKTLWLGKFVHRLLSRLRVGEMNRA